MSYCPIPVLNQGGRSLPLPVLNQSIGAKVRNNHDEIESNCHYAVRGVGRLPARCDDIPDIYQTILQSDRPGGASESGERGSVAITSITWQRPGPTSVSILRRVGHSETGSDDLPRAWRQGDVDLLDAHQKREGRIERVRRRTHALEQAHPLCSQNRRDRDNDGEKGRLELRRPARGRDSFGPADWP